MEDLVKLNPKQLLFNIGFKLRAQAKKADALGFQLPDKLDDVANQFLCDLITAVFGEV